MRCGGELVRCEAVEGCGLGRDVDQRVDEFVEEGVAVPVGDADLYGPGRVESSGLHVEDAQVRVAQDAASPSADMFPVGCPAFGAAQSAESIVEAAVALVQRLDVPASVEFEPTVDGAQVPSFFVGGPGRPVGVAGAYELY